MIENIKIKALYADLAEKLNAGAAAALVSEYGANGVRKTLCTDGDAAAWRKITDLYATADIQTDGPVAFIADAKASLMDAQSLTVVERYTPKPRMLILGGGHIALALTKMAKLTDFYVVVFDDRPAFANPNRFPEADEVICDDFSRLFERLQIRRTDYVVIVTRGHKHDTECLEGVLKGEAPAYTGMIGSRRRVAIVLKQLAEAGYPQARIDRVYSPIGLRIAAVTPAEISVSILAEIIQVKRQGAAASGPEAGGDPTCDVEIAEWLSRHGDEADALITVLTTRGPVPRETGAKMAMNYEGRTAGTIGGGCAESDIMQTARTVIREGGWKVVEIDMEGSAEEDGMVCGGKMWALIEAPRRARNIPAKDQPPRTTV
jgi:xanthine dehydrogenase accessory factor